MQLSMMQNIYKQAKIQYYKTSKQRYKNIKNIKRFVFVSKIIHNKPYTTKKKKLKQRKKKHENQTKNKKKNLL
jgi:hypothetical protein